MTEAMSRHEIEDVLSSIRRLVSHDDRAAPARGKEGAGKLVLTSALRVDDAAPGATRPMQASAPSFSAAPANPAALHDARDMRAQQPEDQSHTNSQPVFAEAPVRGSLLARIAQAGQNASDSGPVRHATPESSTAPETLEDAVTEGALEATLARLEQALSITPAEPEDPTIAVIDEDALTQIVARIVRQELQGELGERITRNIRKLVRAEVARELQMRNL